MRGAFIQRDILRSASKERRRKKTKEKSGGLDGQQVVLHRSWVGSKRSWNFLARFSRVGRNLDVLTKHFLLASSADDNAYMTWKLVYLFMHLP